MSLLRKLFQENFILEKTLLNFFELGNLFGSPYEYNNASSYSFLLTWKYTGYIGSFLRVKS